MAVRLLLFGVCILIALFVLAHESPESGIRIGRPYGWPASLPTKHSRKLLMSRSLVVEGDLRPSEPPDGEEVVRWELWKVPSGPDPLHHNRSPKKPQTP